MHVHDNHDVERANLNIQHSISMHIYFFAIYSRGYPGCPYLSMAVGKVHAATATHRKGRSWPHVVWMSHASRAACLIPWGTSPWSQVTGQIWSDGGWYFSLALGPKIAWEDMGTPWWQPCACNCVSVVEPWWLAKALAVSAWGYDDPVWPSAGCAACVVQSPLEAFGLPQNCSRLVFFFDGFHSFGPTTTDQEMLNKIYRTRGSNMSAVSRDRHPSIVSTASGKPSQSRRRSATRLK